MADRLDDARRAAASVARPLGRRAGQLLLVTVVVATACFAIMQSLPGDEAFRIAAGRYGYDYVTAETADAVRAELGLDRSSLVQYAEWLASTLRLDLGISMVTGNDVAHEVVHHLTASATLALAALAIALVVGVTLGTLAATRAGTRVDRMIVAFAAVGRSLPPFILGLLLILVLAVHLGALPSAGHGDVANIVLPALTLAVGSAALMTVVARQAALELQDAAHVQFARVRGLKGWRLQSTQVLRIAGVTVASLLGVQFVLLLEGVVVVETLFAWPGIGHALVHAVFWRDLPMIQACALAFAAAAVLVSALSDVTTLALDPRSRA